MAVNPGWENTSYRKHTRSEQWLDGVVTSEPTGGYYSSSYVYTWKINAKMDGKSTPIASGRGKTQLMCSQCADALMAAILKLSKRCKGGCHAYVVVGERERWTSFPTAASAPGVASKFKEPRWVLIATPPEDDGTILCQASQATLHPDGSAVDFRTGNKCEADVEVVVVEPEAAKGLPPLREWES